MKVYLLFFTRGHPYIFQLSAIQSHCKGARWTTVIDLKIIVEIDRPRDPTVGSASLRERAVTLILTNNL